MLQKLSAMINKRNESKLAASAAAHGGRLLVVRVPPCARYLFQTALLLLPAPYCSALLGI